MKPIDHRPRVEELVRTTLYLTRDISMWEDIGRALVHYEVGSSATVVTQGNIREVIAPSLELAAQISSEIREGRQALLSELAALLASSSPLPTGHASREENVLIESWKTWFGLQRKFRRLDTWDVGENLEAICDAMSKARTDVRETYRVLSAKYQIEECWSIPQQGEEPNGPFKHHHVKNYMRVLWGELLRILRALRDSWR